MIGVKCLGEVEVCRVIRSGDEVSITPTLTLVSATEMVFGSQMPFDH